MPTFYLAWVNEGVTFSAGTHATVANKIWDGVEGEEIVFSIKIEHSEGDFASLTAELINPRVGLLSAGRNQWVWLSADDGAGPEPLFNGRIVGVPKSLANEIIQVQFVALPPDFIAQKAALADSLRVLPWWDPVWLQEKVDDDDTVLEAYSLRWHIDRVTLDVTASDIIAGEAGSIAIGEGDHLYDGFDLSYGDAPLRRVQVKLTVTWPQTGSGDIDLTRQLSEAFQAAGSPYPPPFVASLTGDGLLSDWPAPLADIGGGWTVAASSTIEPATWLQPKAYVVHFGDRDESLDLSFWPWLGVANMVFGVSFAASNQLSPLDPSFLGPGAAFAVPPATVDPFGSWNAAFSLGVYSQHFVAHYDAKRDRSETAIATVEADVQSVLVEPGAAETETIELSSEFVGQPIDSGNALPIGDLRRNTYFKTDRGSQSFEYGLLLARAKLLARSRAVVAKMTTSWSIAAGISCRHNIDLTDYRVKGGAIGKVIAYTLSADGDAGEAKAEISMGCTIGYGEALAAAAAGTPTYVEDGYVEDGYQQRTGAEVELLAGVLQYQSFDNFEVTDDDGVDLFNMTASRVVNSLVVAGGLNPQRAAIDAAAALPSSAAPDPVQALRDNPTIATIDLVPVEGGAFHVDYEIDVSTLVVPATIDLEASV